MNWRAVFAIVRKDLKVVTQNKGVMIPIIVVPLVLFGLLPWLSLFAPNMVNIGGANMDELTALIANMPAGLQNELAPYTVEQQTIVFFLVYMLAPMFLIIPLMVASVIAADSFAGERERRTLEALLYTPTTDRDLFIGKLLSSWLPAILVALAGFILYAVMVNLAAWPTMGEIFFPNLMWVVMTLWVVPAAAGLGLSSMVLVSIRAQGFQDAYQTGGMIVLPILLLVFGQIAGVMYFSVWLVLLLGLLLWAIDAALIWFGSRTFRRGRLIARL
ncbi:MAG: ABC transporter permease subunit [Anaerolineales bacterium]